MRLRRPTSLQRTILVAAVGIGGISMVAMMTTVLMTVATARELAANSRAASAEERIADRLVEATNGQRDAAFEFAQSRDPASAARFRLHGREAYQAVRQYLFLPMPLDARLLVERMKEAHERFEVQANRAFEMTSGDRRPMYAAIMQQTVELSRAVSAFARARDVQRDLVTAHSEARLTRLKAITFALALLLLVVLIVAAWLLRRVVLRPLADFERAARTLAAGDDSARVPEQSFREFATVADSFNQMAGNLRRTQRDLVQHEKLSAMGEMLAGLAHELNNPLAAILASAEVLEAELGDPAAATLEPRRLASELATPMVREARRARDLVRNLLNLSRRSGGDAQAVDVGATARDAAALRESAFAHRSKRLDIHVPDGLVVMADPIRLQVALVNLINNGLDAVMERGSTVTVSARRVGESVEIVVQDDGPGFRDPLRALEPFYTTKEVGRGTGLGLALVHRFVHDASGTVVIANAPDGGAILRMTLPAPASAPQGPPTGDATSVIPASKGAGVAVAKARISVTPSGARGRKPLVLVVDDEESMRVVQSRLLGRMGAEVLLAESGAAAQQLLRERPVDLVIADVRMPGECDGPGLIRWMRERFPRLAESAFLVSGELQLSDKDRVVSIERILPKPFDLADYVDRIGSALRLVANS